MKARIINWLFLAVTALTAYLVVGLIEEWLLDQTKGRGVYLSTLVGMLCIVFVFLPLFQWLEQASQRLVSWATRSSSRVFGRYGLYVFFGIALVALFLAYLYVWFSVRVV